MARPRKPTALKVVGGTDRPGREVPDQPEPAPLLDLTPPSHLSDNARACWARLAQMLADMGVLTVADLIGFERMCCTYAELQAADYAIEMLGDTTYETKSAKDGFMRRAHPEVAQRADAERRFLAYLSQFGLTPAARTKVSAPGAKKADALSRFFG